MIKGNEPHDTDHWMCPECDATFAISEYEKNENKTEVKFVRIEESCNLNIICTECNGSMHRYRRDGIAGVIRICEECDSISMETV